MATPHHFLPTPEQELLLKAALLDGDAAAESWLAWRERINIENVDFASQRLLPLLHHRLVSLGVSHADLQRYQSVARFIWLDNHLRIRQIQEILRLLKKAGIAAMPLKGFALASLYYGDFRLRAMNDFDVLVPTDRAADACHALMAVGWRPANQDLLHSGRCWSTRHAIQFQDAQGYEIDLHWHVLYECCWPDADDAFWRHAQPLQLGAMPTRTLSDTGHLLHACLHGGRPNDVPPIRWIADAIMILRKGGVDWDRLLEQGKAFDLVHRLQRTLGYLHRTFPGALPGGVMAKLESMPPSRRERVEERIVSSRTPPVVKSSLLRYCHYQRNYVARGRKEGFRQYLQDAFGTRSVAGTVQWVARRAKQGWPGGTPKPLKLHGD